MKILYKTVWLNLLAVCCCTLAAMPATASVCFVGDSSCGSGADFGSYSTEGSSKLCDAEGYVEISDCDTATKYIAGYCPYDSSYVMCCGREYVYDRCVYPLVTVTKSDGTIDKCGSKYKCQCDTGTYPYQQESSTVCVNTVTKTKYENSIASGASCAYTGYSDNQTTTNIYYSKCSCDRGIYPKSEEDCATDGSSTSENYCKDSDDNTYYTACICGDEFQVIASECEYGIDINASMCQQGDVLKAKECCTCNTGTYPYDDIDDVTGDASPVATYASCESERGCTRGSRYRATSCKTGYKVSNNQCVPKECNELLVDYFDEKGIEDYEIYQSGITPSSTNVIVAEDTTDVDWESFYNKKVISGTAFAQTVTGSDSLTTLVKQQCSETPVLQFTSGSSSTSPLDFISIILKLSSSWSNNGGFTCTNCGLEGTSIYNNQTMELKYNAGLPNTDNMYVDATKLVISNGSVFSSTGYDYTLENLEIKNTAYNTVFFSGKDFTLYNTFRVTGTYIQGGAVGFRYYDIYSTNTYIGCPDGGTGCADDVDNTGYDDSGISLYYVTWYLWEEPSNSYELHMQSRSYIGYPTGQDLGSFGSYNNKIIGSDFMWYYTSCNDGVEGITLLRYCNSLDPLKYINSDGGVSSIGFSGYEGSLLCSYGSKASLMKPKIYISSVIWRGSGSHSQRVNGTLSGFEECVYCVGVW